MHGRVPELRKDELRKLAAVGVLNFIQKSVRQTSVCRACGKETTEKTNDKLKFAGHYAHRRDALWQVERVARNPGPLYEKLEEAGDLTVRMSIAVGADYQRLKDDFNATVEKLQRALVTIGANTQAIRFVRTARYVRYTATVTGAGPDLALAVLVGQQRKTF